MVGRARFELATNWLKASCSTDWANDPILNFLHGIHAVKPLPSITSGLVIHVAALTHSIHGVRPDGRTRCVQIRSHRICRPEKCPPDIFLYRPHPTKLTTRNFSYKWKVISYKKTYRAGSHKQDISTRTWILDPYTFNFPLFWAWWLKRGAIIPKISNMANFSGWKMLFSWKTRIFWTWRSWFYRYPAPFSRQTD